MTLLEISQTLDAILDEADCDPKTMARLEELNHSIYVASHPTPEDLEWDELLTTIEKAKG